MRNLIIRAVTGIVFVSVIVSSFFLPYAFFNIVFLSVALIGVHEFLKISEKEGVSPQSILPFIVSALFFTAFQLAIYSRKLSTILILLCLLLLLAIPTVELFRKKENPIGNIAISILPLWWITFPFSLAGFWAHYLGANSTVLALFILIWLNDTLAYCSGSLFGKHRLFERISPKKSWEGFLIALVLTSIASILFLHIPFFKDPILNNTWKWVGFAIVIILCGTLGDFVESLYKRSAGVKDSGNMLPGHGGILDRFDSFLFAAPAGFIYWMFMAIL